MRNMKWFARMGMPAVLCLVMSGSAAAENGPREKTGSLLGAIVGAVVASKNIGDGSGRIWSGAAGALIGSGVGADVGRSLDRANAAYRASSPGRTRHSQQNLPVPGARIAPGLKRGWSWSRDSSAPAGAPPGYSVRDAVDCRALEGGSLRPAFACRNRHGRWFVLQ